MSAPRRIKSGEKSNKTVRPESRDKICVGVEAGTGGVVGVMSCVVSKCKYKIPALALAI